MSNRLSSHARRETIVSAAVPLFARKGFAGTTTREIAEAAGISEGLLFKHFANKTALYDAIVHEFKDPHPTFEEIRGLPASTQSLVQMVRVTTEHFVTLAGSSELTCARYRMFLRSLCEDGAFACVGMEAYAHALLSVFTDSFEAARRADDLIDDAPDAVTAFWIFVQHQLMLGAWEIPPERATPRVPVGERVRAILRSIGVNDSAVRRLAHGDHMTIEIAQRPACEPTARIAS